MAPSESSENTEHEGEVDILHLLMKAPSKAFLCEYLQNIYSHRHYFKAPESLSKNVANELQITKGQSAKLFLILRRIIQSALREGMTDPREINKGLPGSLNKDLRVLLCKTISEQMKKWSELATSNSVSLPQLLDFGWRVNITMASDAATRMALPSCLLNMKVKCCQGDERPDVVRAVNVELSKETLATMLHGLGKIKDQLNSVAGS